MGKTRWSKQPARTREVDWGAATRRLNERLARDNKLVVWIVRNVRARDEGMGSGMPFVLVGPATRVLHELHKLYGADFVGNDVDTGHAVHNLPVRQVYVMSTVRRQEVPSVCGWENYDTWRSTLLVQGEEDVVLDMSLSTVSRLAEALIERMYEAIETRLSTPEPSLSTVPTGTAGRAPSYAR